MVIVGPKQLVFVSLQVRLSDCAPNFRDFSPLLIIQANKNLQAFNRMKTYSKHVHVMSPASLFAWKQLPACMCARMIGLAGPRPRCYSNLLFTSDEGRLIFLLDRSLACAQCCFSVDR